MVERTEVEIYVRNMVALDVLSKPLSSLGGKAERRRDKAAEEIADLLKDESEVGERIFAKIEKRDEEKARTLREGIEAFKREHPNYGDILENKIAEKRTKSNKYLIFGLNKGYYLASEDYVRVMKDLGFTREEACSMYPHLKEISTRLGKANEQEERTILL